MRTPRLLVALTLAFSLTFAGCTSVTDPATGGVSRTMMTPEQERAVGAQEHPKILAQFGGAYDDPELQAYVEGIGERLAAVSELPELDFTFTVLNDDLVNAFALPGGYVYVTRGLVALANNEAELAGVLAHEIGHVTGRHSAERQTRSVWGQLGTIGAVIAGGLLGGGEGARLGAQLGQAGAGAYLAGYSRDQELEADQLGVRYLDRAGYDPMAMVTFLETMGRWTELQAELEGRQSPAAASSLFATHPRTADRVREAARTVAEPGGRLGRDALLAQVDGVLYGNDPAQGVVRGTSFLHPTLDFAFEAPRGFSLINRPDAVLARGPDGITMQFTAAPLQPDGDPLRHLREVYGGELPLRDVRRLEVNGMNAANGRAQVAQGRQRAVVDLYVIRRGERFWRFGFIDPGGTSRAALRAFKETARSFRSLRPGEAASVPAQRVRVAPVAGRSGDQLARAMAVERAPEAVFMVFNGLGGRRDLDNLDRVKLIAE